jgi:hypothetical protein
MGVYLSPRGSAESVCTAARGPLASGVHSCRRCGPGAGDRSHRRAQRCSPGARRAHGAHAPAGTSRRHQQEADERPSGRRAPSDTLGRRPEKSGRRRARLVAACSCQTIPAGMGREVNVARAVDTRRRRGARQSVSSTAIRTQDSYPRHGNGQRVPSAAARPERGTAPRSNGRSCSLAWDHAIAE